MLSKNPSIFKAEVCKKEKCEKLCGFLHICENFLKKHGCNRRPCRYRHDLKSDHNMFVLGFYEIKDIDFNLLKQLFRVIIIKL